MVIHKKNYYVLLVIFIVTSTISSDQTKKVSFGLVGDVMLGRSVDEAIAKKGILYPWGSMLTTLRSTLFNIANLETTLTKSTQKNPQAKTFNFKSNPSNIDSLLKAQIQVVNLANNHSMDFDNSGLKETLDALDKNNIFHVGAGMNLQEAQKPARFTKEGIRFAVLGFTDNEPSWLATDKKAGINYIQINKKTIESIKKLIVDTKKEADILIVSLHWGANWEKKPSKEFIDFAHTLVDAGADIIHGHSSHIFQGIELYKNKLIFYNTGDFLDDYAIDTSLRNDEAFLYMITVDQQGIQQLQLVPALISNNQVNKAEGADAKRIIQKMQALSKELGSMHIDDQGFWQR